MRYTERRQQIKNLEIGDMVKFLKKTKIYDLSFHSHDIAEGTIGIITNKLSSGIEETFEDIIEVFINNIACNDINIWDTDIEFIKKLKEVEDDEIE